MLKKKVQHIPRYPKSVWGNRSLGYSAVLFCLLLAWFYWGSPWYPSARLFVRGHVAQVSSQMSIRWDSGHGLNGYEWERYQLRPLPAKYSLEDGMSLQITRTGQHRSASLGAKVVLRNIFLDDKKYTPSVEQLPPGVEFNDGMLVFSRDGDSLQLIIHPKRSVRLEFLVSNRAGEVMVRIGEERAHYDLYSSNDENRWSRDLIQPVNAWFVNRNGEFTISMPMPRYPVHWLRVEATSAMAARAVEIQTEDGAAYSLTDRVPFTQGVDIAMGQVGQQLKRYFHRDRFLMQCLFALFTTWLLMSLFSFASKFRGVLDIIAGENRYLFWLMLLTGCMVFSFWQIAFWPGIASTDSLKIWRAAQIPGTYLGDHPPLNVIFYLFLSQFWNNVAVVPLVQNFLSSLLIAHIFFSLFRKGLPVYFLLPCFLLIIFSLPVGLYTIVLWKDVPYALLVVCIGYRLACFSFYKQRNLLQVSWREWSLLLCLTLALVGFRHNGIIYLLVVPFIILLFGFVRVRLRVVSAVAVMVLLFAVVFFLLPGRTGTPGYLQKQTKIYLTQAIDRTDMDYLKERGKRYFGIFNVNQRDMQWDLVHLCMYGRYSNDFLRKSGWNDVYPFLPLPTNTTMKKAAGIAWVWYWKSYQVPWVYFSWNPFYMLFLYPILPFLYKKLPMAAAFSLFIFIPVAVLVFLNIFNWRYYYFAYLAVYFLLPMLITDVLFNKNKKVKMSSLMV